MLCGVERQVGRRQVAPGADLVERRTDQRRDRQRAVAEQHLDLVAAVEQHARVTGASPQQRGGGDRLAAEDVVEAAAETRRPGGEEAPDLGLDSGGRVDAAYLCGELLEAVGERAGEGRRVVEVAGGQVVVGYAGEERLARCARPGRAR